MSIEKRTFYKEAGNHDYWYPESEVVQIKKENSKLISVIKKAIQGLQFSKMCLSEVSMSRAIEDVDTYIDLLKETLKEIKNKQGA